MKLKFFLPIALLIAVVVVALTLHSNGTGSTKNPQTSTHQSSKQATPQTFNKTKHSLTDPTSQWVIVNKQHQLQPKDYAPSDLTVPNVPLRVPGNESMQVRAEMARALETMFQGAKADGLSLMLSSGYRSYSYQVNLYNSYVQSQGQATADQESARPGYSEHQTGLAADIEGTDKTCEVEQCWADTPEGKWLAANAYRYGLIIRYPKGLENITGYEYEPWHVRYVGIELATEMHKQNIQTLEQFFNVSGGQNY